MQPVIDHANHTAFSDPGRFRELLVALPTDVAELSAIARNVIVHYRASGHELPDSTRNDVNARWLEDALAHDQARHPMALDEPRTITERVQGCCRDHTLFCIGALRTHGIPARSRVGFAGYFRGDFRPDHVIVEAWIGDAWRRFDPEIEAPTTLLANPLDMALDDATGTGFVTAASVWSAHRAGAIDASIYGVDPTLPVFTGERFIFDEVIYEVAHRFGDELLLWDSWGAIGVPGEPVTEEDAAWMDDVAGLLIASDHGDREAELELLHRYRNTEADRLRPGQTIIQASPFGDPPIETTLDRTSSAADRR